MDKGFYYPNKILSIKDKNGRPPELIFSTGNKGAGKTFGFKTWLTRRALEYDEMFLYIVRYFDDIAGIVDSFWEDIGPLKFPGKTMVQKSHFKGKAGELIVDGTPVGIVAALNRIETIKRHSSFFARTVRGYFDEFMTEDGKYLTDEYTAFDSLRQAAARGGAKGAYVSYYPVYFNSNFTSAYNPYYEHNGIIIPERAKYVRGDGWVVEQVYNQAAADAIRENLRTASQKSIDYATSNKYLLDTDVFVRQIPGKKRCQCVIRQGGKLYGIWDTAQGIYYVSAKLKTDSPFVFALDNGDHNEHTILLNKSMPLSKYLRKAYDMGQMRFESGACRQAFILALGIVK